MSRNYTSLKFKLKLVQLFSAWRAKYKPAQSPTICHSAQHPTALFAKLFKIIIIIFILLIMKKWREKKTTHRIQCKQENSRKPQDVGQLRRKHIFFLLQCLHFSWYAYLRRYWALVIPWDGIINIEARREMWLNQAGGSQQCTSGSMRPVQKTQLTAPRTFVCGAPHHEVPGPHFLTFPPNQSISNSSPCCTYTCSAVARVQMFTYLPGSLVWVHALHVKWSSRYSLAHSCHNTFSAPLPPPTTRRWDQKWHLRTFDQRAMTRKYSLCMQCDCSHDALLLLLAMALLLIHMKSLQK